MRTFDIADDFLQQEISGRYVTNENVFALLKKLPEHFEVNIAGKSVLDKPIYSVRVGNGKQRLYLWSQMHGNETTTTKGLIDFLFFLASDNRDALSFLEYFSFLVIPQLNPDGAELYTRSNANEIDLNRDSVMKSQPETKVLHRLFDEFQPHFAFNLHDQRTIFGVGNKSATMSFLAPSYNENRDVNEVRTQVMKLIVAINKELQYYIPDQVGRFDDAFNVNCIGDYFMQKGTPTVLFEAGHYSGDYEREITRKLVFVSLFESLVYLLNKSDDDDFLCKYLQIPENIKIFNDVVFINPVNGERTGVQYKEVLRDYEIFFEANVDHELILPTQKGHLEVLAALEKDATVDDIYHVSRRNKFHLLKNGLISVNDLLKEQK